MRLVQDSFGIFSGLKRYFQDSCRIKKIFSGFSKDHFRIFTGFFQDLFRNYLGSFLDSCRIRQKYFQDF